MKLKWDAKFVENVSMYVWYLIFKLIKISLSCKKFLKIKITGKILKKILKTKFTFIYRMIGVCSFFDIYMKNNYLLIHKLNVFFLMSAFSEKVFNDFQWVFFFAMNKKLYFKNFVKENYERWMMRNTIIEIIYKKKMRCQIRVAVLKKRNPINLVDFCFYYCGVVWCNLYTKC